MNIQQQRARALEIVIEKTSNAEYTQIDYDLDEACRDLLDLPPRPQKSLPYQGWMKGMKTKSKNTLKISQNCIDLVKRWEGFRSKAYLCPAGVWTIGYGHTSSAKPHMTITKSTAEVMLRGDLEIYANGVRNAVKVPLNQNQFDALVSFCYNIGIGAFSRSTLVRSLNSKNYLAAAKQFDKWVYANRVKLPGLVARRKAERELFEK